MDQQIEGGRRPKGEKLSRAQASRDVGRVWRVLCGFDEPHSKYERQLRYFQLKFWLTGHETYYVSRKTSGKIFGLWVLQEHLDTIKGISPVNRILQALSDREVRSLLSDCFYDSNVKGILSSQSLEVHSSLRGTKEYARRLHSEVEFGLARVLLRHYFNNDGLTDARRLYIRLRSQGKTEGNTYFVGEHLYDYKISFLIVAHLLLGDMLVLTDHINIRNQVVPDEEIFQRFCCHVIGLSQLLGTNEVSDLQKYTGLNGIGIEGFEGIPDFDRARSRASAFVRQQPGVKGNVGKT